MLQQTIGSSSAGANFIANVYKALLELISNHNQNSQSVPFGKLSYYICCIEQSMYKFIANRLFFALAIGATARIFPGIELDGLASALILGFVLSLLDWLLKPVLVLLTLPVTLFTFGLWLFVINTLLVMLASWLVTGFEVETFGAALIFSFAISCINALLDYLFAK